MVQFKDFSGPSSVFQVLFKASLIFKDFSRQSCVFKYFSSLCEPFPLMGEINLPSIIDIFPHHAQQLLSALSSANVLSNW